MLCMVLGHAQAAGFSSSVSLSDLRLSIEDPTPTVGQPLQVMLNGSTQVGLSAGTGESAGDGYLTMWTPGSPSNNDLKIFPLALQASPAQGAQLGVGVSDSQQISVSTTLRNMDDVQAALRQSSVTYAASPESYIGIHPDTGVPTYYRRQGTQTYSVYELHAESWVGSAFDGFGQSTAQAQPIGLSLSGGDGVLHIDGTVTFTMSLAPELLNQLQPDKWEVLNTWVQAEALVFVNGQGFDLIAVADRRGGASINGTGGPGAVSLQNGQLSFTQSFRVSQALSGDVGFTNMHVRMNASAHLYGMQMTADNTTVVWGSAVRPVVPEPGTWAQMGLGLIGLVAAVRRKRRAA